MIDKTAIINSKAKIGNNVSIGAYAVVEENVTIANNVTISTRAHIKGNTTIGEGTFIGIGALIGEAPQMFASTENIGRVDIGKDNIIREYVTIHSSTSKDKATVVGNNNFFMVFSHIAHDCRIADNVVICNGALLSGHVQVADRAFISGNVVVHQFVRIGKLAMIGGLSRVNQDVVPFMMVVGDSRVWGLNLVGIKRAGIEPAQRKNIKQAYNLLYRKRIAQKKALEELGKIDSKHVKEMVVFILSSQRGICGPKKSSLFEKLFLDYPYTLRNRIPAYDLFLKSQKSQP